VSGDMRVDLDPRAPGLWLRTALYATEVCNFTTSRRHRPRWWLAAAPDMPGSGQLWMQISGSGQAACLHARLARSHPSPRCRLFTTRRSLAQRPMV